jgi:tetratricopeptide (TPR) repeat protein/predicted esterase
MPIRPPDGEESPDALERVLAECIEAWSAGDTQRIDALFERHPALAERLRERLAALQRLGMLGEDATGETPSRMGRYAIQRRLGQGGMSVVYLARDEQIGRRVALKTCHAFTTDDERMRARFEREIQAVARLEHPSIVRIFDVGEADGRPYFTMEYVEGATLAEIIEALRMRPDPSAELSGAMVRRVVEERVAAHDPEGARQSVEHAWPRTWVETLCRWMLDVSDALAHAHAAGILHRDVKPSNIIVGLDGRARLFDLGLARIGNGPGLTRSGDFTGTPYYVSPEQLIGRTADVDPRSDIFSLGVTLYELLTLRRPFDGRSTAQVLKRIVDHEPVPPRRIDTGVPPDLETICLTAIEKSPDARYQRMDDLTADLQRFLEFVPVRARPIGWARRAARFMRRRPTLATAAGLALVIAVGLPVGLLWANQAIADQRDLAEGHAAEATRQADLNGQVTDFLIDLFQLTPQEIANAETITARQILDRGASRIPTGFEDQPLVRASLMRANGRVFHNMGLDAEALRLLDRAFAIFQRELGEGHVETAGLLHELAQVHLANGDRATGARLAQRALSAFARADLADDVEALRCRITLADAATVPADRQLARRMIEEALQAPLDRNDGETGLTADLWERLAKLQTATGEVSEAEHSLREAVRLRRSAWVPDPLAIASGLEGLAALRREAGDGASADRLMTEGGELRRSAAPAAAATTTDGAIDLTGPFALRPPWQAEYDAVFQEGVTALQVGRHADAATSFQRCLELSPGHTVAAYNVACSLALAGDTDAALDWLGRAIDYGFGFLVDGPDVIAKDPDLETLRDRPRWTALIETMTSRRDAAARYAAAPAVYCPAGLEAETGLPLLVVLHADGSTKDQVVAGPWKTVADRLGMVLLAPSAATPTAGSGAEGMRWFRNVGDYLDRPWAYETPVIEVIRAYCQEHGVDRTRVFMAGEGLGALLAADIALTAPGLFRGALLINGPLHPELAGERTRVAASLGVALEVVLDERQPVAARPDGMPLATLADDIARAATPWGLDQRLGVRHVEASTTQSPADVRIAGLTALQNRLGDHP